MKFWDQDFSVSGFRHGTQPRAFLVWLARQGHRVTAMEGARVGLHEAQALAWLGEVTLGEGPGHPGKTRVTRYLGPTRA